MTCDLAGWEMTLERAGNETERSIREFELAVTDGEDFVQGRFGVTREGDGELRVVCAASGFCQYLLVSPVVLTPTEDESVNGNA